MAVTWPGLPRVAWDNAAHSLLERTLQTTRPTGGSSCRGFLAADEMLRTMKAILAGCRWTGPQGAQPGAYGTFAATERVLMAAVKAGADRQDMHELIRGHSMRAWETLPWRRRPNPLADSLEADPRLGRFLTVDQMRELMDYGHP